MSAGPQLWIRQGYDLALAGEAVPPAIDARAGAWMQIGHDLAGRLADAQIEETGTIDSMPLPAWPELAQQAIKENQEMGLARPQTDLHAALKMLAREAQRQAEETAEHAAGLVRDLNGERRRICALEARIAEMERDAAGLSRQVRELEEANRQLRAEHDKRAEHASAIAPDGLFGANCYHFTNRAGSPRIMLYRAGGNPSAITCEIISPTGHVYAGANGLTPAAALEEAIQRYERSRRGDNGRRILDPYDHPDAGQEAEEYR